MKFKTILLNLFEKKIILQFLIVMDFRQTYQKEKTSNKDKESLQILKKSSGRYAGSNRRPKMCESDR